MLRPARIITKLSSFYQRYYYYCHYYYDSIYAEKKTANAR
jgi:hypothetical protein